VTTGKKYKFRLKAYKEDTGFTVPDGYFESLNTRIREKLNNGGNTYRFNPDRGGRFITRFAMAASFAGFVFIVLTGIRFITRMNNFPEESTGTELALIYENPVYEPDELMLYEILEQENAESTSLNNDAEYWEEEIIEYLLLDETDIESLIQEL
jgi:hypothetical protein